MGGAALNDGQLLVREAATEAEWSAACALLHNVYVGEGFAAAEKSTHLRSRKALEEGGVLLIALNGSMTVIGAVLFLHVQSPMQQLARGGEREFRLLAVNPEARGFGTGAALVKACVQRAQKAGATGLVLWTRPVMRSAQRLYERLGFVHATERDVPDERGWDRVVYTMGPWC